MNKNRITKRMFNTGPEGKRGTGRPKLRWGDSVDHDDRILGEMNWAQNKEEWWKILKKARVNARL
jgi:hypothetical protein